MNEEEVLRKRSQVKKENYFKGLNKNPQQYQEIIKKKILVNSQHNYQIHMGTVLRILREEFDISQCELAAYLKLKRQTISNWENGNAYPEVVTLIELADYFQVSLDLLLFRKKYI